MPTRSIETFKSIEAASAADEQHYLSLTKEERVRIFMSLVTPQDRRDAIVERCVRIYPLPKPVVRGNT